MFFDLDKIIDERMPKVLDLFERLNGELEKFVKVLKELERLL